MSRTNRCSIRLPGETASTKMSKTSCVSMAVRSFRSAESCWNCMYLSLSLSPQFYCPCFLTFGAFSLICVWCFCVPRLIESSVGELGNHMCNVSFSVFCFLKWNPFSNYLLEAFIWNYLYNPLSRVFVSSFVTFLDHLWIGLKRWWLQGKCFFIVSIARSHLPASMSRYSSCELNSLAFLSFHFLELLSFVLIRTWKLVPSKRRSLSLFCNPNLHCFGFPLQSVAASCVWLAAKLEESPKEISAVLQVLWRMERRRNNLPIEVLDLNSPVCSITQIAPLCF